MDKIVDHLFILEDKVIENFQETTLTLEHMKTVDVAQKRRTKQRKRLEAKITGNLTFNEQKEFQKLEREIKDLKSKKLKLSYFEGNVEEAAIEKKEMNCKTSSIKWRQKKNAGLNCAKMEG
jgi:ATP-binding cassette subfamily F protein uup